MRVDKTGFRSRLLAVTKVRFKLSSEYFNISALIHWTLDLSHAASLDFSLAPCDSLFFRFQPEEIL